MTAISSEGADAGLAEVGGAFMSMPRSRALSSGPVRNNRPATIDCVSSNVSDFQSIHDRSWDTHQVMSNAETTSSQRPWLGTLTFSAAYVRTRHATLGLCAMTRTGPSRALSSVIQPWRALTKRPRSPFEI